MNAKPMTVLHRMSTIIVQQCTNRTQHCTRSARRIVTALVAVSVVVIHVESVSAAGPNEVTLYALVQDGQGQAAVDQVAGIALQLGGWGPAPGDVLAYDEQMARIIRAEVKVVDRGPWECDIPRVRDAMIGECERDYACQQDLVRFGYRTFFDYDESGEAVPRERVDDILATYIEEVGHSWQEYLHETEGRGYGQRTQQTTWDQGHAWSNGWEYQVKRYILSLDGILLSLSADQHAELRDAICAQPDGVFRGYANPVGHDVPRYGPPPGWPNPEGWSLSAPTTEEHESFCTTS